MNAEQICIDYLNVTLHTAKKKPELLYKIIHILQVKQLTAVDIAKHLDIKVDTVMKYLERGAMYKATPQQLTYDQQVKINKFLKIEHLNKYAKV
jgi:orotate phosphoribosyltransferase-like protein